MALLRSIEPRRSAHHGEAVCPRADAESHARLPVWVIQAQVGHVAPEMMKTYSHIRRQALNQAADALEPTGAVTICPTELTRIKGKARRARSEGYVTHRLFAFGSPRDHDAYAEADRRTATESTGGAALLKSFRRYPSRSLD